MASNQGISGRAAGRLQSGFDLGAPVFCFKYASALSTGASTTEVALPAAPFKLRIVRVDYVCTEATGADNTVKLTDGTNDLTDALNYSAKGDTDLFSSGEIKHAYHDIAKGLPIKVVKTETTAVSSLDVYIWAVRV